MRWHVRVRALALAWLEHHAQIAESKRIAEVNLLAKTGDVYDPAGLDEAWN